MREAEVFVTQSVNLPPDGAPLLVAASAWGAAAVPWTGSVVHTLPAVPNIYSYAAVVEGAVTRDDLERLLCGYERSYLSRLGVHPRSGVAGDAGVAKVVCSVAEGHREANSGLPQAQLASPANRRASFSLTFRTGGLGECEKDRGRTKQGVRQT